MARHTDSEVATAQEYTDLSGDNEVYFEEADEAEDEFGQQ